MFQQTAKNTSDRAFKTVASLPRVVRLTANNNAPSDAQKAVRMRYAVQPDEDDLDREVEAEEGCAVSDSYLKGGSPDESVGRQADRGQMMAGVD